MTTFTIFFKDIFDVPDVNYIENINTLFDIESSTINYKKLLSHQRIYTNVLFRHIWSKLVKYPCSLSIVFEFSKQNTSSIDKAIEFIVKGTFLKYMNTNLESIKDQLTTFSHSILCQNNLMHELQRQLCERHGISIDRTKPLFQSYIEFLNKSYFENEKKNIEIFNLYQKNIFCDTIVSYNDTGLTVRDCISYIASKDHYFCRMLLNSICIYLETCTSFIKHFVKSIFKSTKDRIIIFCSNTVKTYLLQDDVIVNLNVIFFNISFSFQLEYLLPIMKLFISDTKIKTPVSGVIISDEVIDLYSNQIQIVPIYKSSPVQIEENKFILPLVDNSKLFGIEMFDFMVHQLFNNVTLFKVTSYLVQYSMKYRIENTPLQINNNANNCVLLIDNRINIMDILSIYVTFSNLKAFEWSLVIMGSKSSINYMKSALESFLFVDCNIEFIHDVRLEKAPFDIEVYNEIMKDPKTWNQIKKYKKCLIIQDDGILVRKGLENSEFIDQDYVGSPWIDYPGNQEIKDKCGHLCGNGGFSLRDINKMYHIANEFSFYKYELFNKNLQLIPEDVFFAKYIKKINGNVPNVTCNLFGTEQVMTMNSFGFHKFWAYHPFKLIYEYFKNL